MRVDKSLGMAVLVLDDGRSVPHSTAVLAASVPRAVLEHFAEHGTLPPVWRGVVLAQDGEALGVEVNGLHLTVYRQVPNFLAHVRHPDIPHRITEFVASTEQTAIDGVECRLQLLRRVLGPCS